MISENQRTEDVFTIIEERFSVVTKSAAIRAVVIFDEMQYDTFFKEIDNLLSRELEIEKSQFSLELYAIFLNNLELILTDLGLKLNPDAEKSIETLVTIVYTMNSINELEAGDIRTVGEICEEGDSLNRVVKLITELTALRTVEAYSLVDDVSPVFFDYVKKELATAITTANIDYEEGERIHFVMMYLRSKFNNLKTELDTTILGEELFRFSDDTDRNINTVIGKYEDKLVDIISTRSDEVIGINIYSLLTLCTETKDNIADSFLECFYDYLINPEKRENVFKYLEKLENEIISGE